jgi:hypothetical protein
MYKFSANFFEYDILDIGNTQSKCFLIILGFKLLVDVFNQLMFGKS